MKKEEVMYVKLPDGAKYRRVEVTEDGRIGIVYTRKCVDNKQTIKNNCSSIPKPTALIGGTEVYQKDNGTPYWYCKIKEGRDEFMYLYFDDLTEKDLLYHTNKFAERGFTTLQEEDFEANVLKALKNKPKEGYRWIPVFEPSLALNNQLQFVARDHVLRGLNYYQWEERIKDYSPQNGSQQASITTYYLLLFRWLKDGVANIKQLVWDSKKIGHYCDSKNAKNHYEITGKREFGGLYGFVGNTFKIVKDSESNSGFSRVGGNIFSCGDKCPAAHAVHEGHPEMIDERSVCLLELTK